MNFKIEFNYLNVDNYPSIERHFEKMANKGWLIYKVFTSSLFIYKKIEPQQLDFSISPYEIERYLHRKSREEIEEFQSVSKSVGWDFATKADDLLIYYKPTNVEAIPLQTDAEEEFITLEKIMTKNLTLHYMSIVIYILFILFIANRLVHSVQAMQDGYTQIVALMLFFGLLMSISTIRTFHTFLNINQKNIENGQELEFNEPSQWSKIIFYSGIYLTFILFIVYSIYNVVVLNNFRTSASLVVAFVTISLVVLYRFTVKPKKISTGYKVAGLAVLGLVAGFFSSSFYTWTAEVFSAADNHVDYEQYRVLTYDNLAMNQTESYSYFTKNASVIIPESYKYTSHAGNNEQLQTEYSRALNESTAKYLVNRYVLQADSQFSWRSSGGRMDPEMIAEAEKLWNVEDVQYLANQSDLVVLRNANEVFYLSGLDFTDAAVVKAVENQLGME